MTMTDDIALACRLAEAARAAIRPHFRAQVQSERKADASPVTVADRAAEEAMRRILTAEVPQDGVIGEEFGATEGRSGRSWVLDPIDGTTGFLAGRPLFGTLIALVVDGWPVMGLIDQPILGERWIGAAGRPTRSTAWRRAPAPATRWPMPRSPPPGRITSTITRPRISWPWRQRPITSAW